MKQCLLITLPGMINLILIFNLTVGLQSLEQGFCPCHVFNKREPQIYVLIPPQERTSVMSFMAVFFFFLISHLESHIVFSFLSLISFIWIRSCAFLCLSWP